MNSKWWTDAEEARALRAGWTCEYSDLHAGWLWLSPWADAGLLGDEYLRVNTRVWWDRRGRSHSLVPASGALSAILDGCGEAP